MKVYYKHDFIKGRHLGTQWSDYEEKGPLWPFTEVPLMTQIYEQVGGPLRDRLLVFSFFDQQSITELSRLILHEAETLWGIPPDLWMARELLRHLWGNSGGSLVGFIAEDDFFSEQGDGDKSKLLLAVCA